MFGSRSLIDTVQDGDLAKIRRLVDKGADVNARGMLQMTPLMCAVQGGREDIVRYFLSLPETDVTALNAGGTSALMIAARLGNLNIVKAMLEDARTDPNQLGRYGGTALMNAAGFGHMDIVKELLKIDGISLAETYTDKKYSPISIARKNHQDAIADLLETFAAQRTRKPSPPAPKP